MAENWWPMGCVGFEWNLMGPFGTVLLPHQLKYQVRTLAVGAETTLENSLKSGADSESSQVHLNSSHNILSPNPVAPGITAMPGFSHKC